VGKRFRPLTGRERAFAERILAELRRYQGLSTGNLYKNAFPASELDRRAFERLLDALARAKAVALSEDAFDKDGETIRFRRAKLGSVGTRALDGDAILLEDAGESVAAAAGPSVKIRRKGETRLALTPQDPSLLDQKLVDKLKAWRKVRAKAQGVPAFVVMSDRLLLAVAARRPATLEELARLKGAGKRFVEKNGAALLALLHG
jgi:ATP-dependent DNA helicase RecQ